jgi:SPX domain protein involved in polyphosphate accumulation
MALRRGLRYELKYLLRREQHDALAAELRKAMDVDAYGDARGVYPITSLYYDSPDYKAYWDKLDGHRNRRKVRVRVYGNATVTPDQSCFLEVKQRIDKLMRKRRIVLPYEQAIAFDDFETLSAAHTGADRALLSEVYFLYRTLQLRPACVVTYDRMAFEGRDPYPDLRVTLDTQVRGRAHDLSLLSTGYAADQQALPVGYAILEVKVNHTVPAWLAQLLADQHCTFYRISKYCRVLESSKAIAARQHVVAARPDTEMSPRGLAPA